MPRAKQTARKSTGGKAPIIKFAPNIFDITSDSSSSDMNSNVNNKCDQEQKNEIKNNNNVAPYEALHAIENEGNNKMNKIIEEMKQHFEKQHHMLKSEITQLKKIIHEKDTEMNSLKKQFSNDIHELKMKLTEMNKENSDISKLLKLCRLSDAELIYNKFLNDGFDKLKKMKHINDRILKQMGIDQLNDRLQLLNGIETLLLISPYNDRHKSKGKSRSRSRSRSRKRNIE